MKNKIFYVKQKICCHRIIPFIPMQHIRFIWFAGCDKCRSKRQHFVACSKNSGSQCLLINNYNKIKSHCCLCLFPTDTWRTRVTDRSRIISCKYEYKSVVPRCLPKVGSVRVIIEKRRSPISSYIIQRSHRMLSLGIIIKEHVLQRPYVCEYSQASRYSLTFCTFPSPQKNGP